MLQQLNYEDTIKETEVLPISDPITGLGFPPFEPDPILGPVRCYGFFIQALRSSAQGTASASQTQRG